MFPDYYYAVSPRYFYFLSGRPHVPRVKKGPLSAPRFLLYVPTIFRRMPGIEPELKIVFSNYFTFFKIDNKSLDQDPNSMYLDPQHLILSLGRRGPLHVSFTIAELRELIKLPGVRTSLHPSQFQTIQV